MRIREKFCYFERDWPSFKANSKCLIVYFGDGLSNSNSWFSFNSHDNLTDDLQKINSKFSSCLRNFPSEFSPSKLNNLNSNDQQRMLKMTNKKRIPAIVGTEVLLNLNTKKPKIRK